MSTTMAPNVKAVSSPGKRTVYSMCGMCAVRCPMEVTVEDGRITWLQGNTHDKASAPAYVPRAPPVWLSRPTTSGRRRR